MIISRFSGSLLFDQEKMSVSKSETEFHYSRETIILEESLRNGRNRDLYLVTIFYESECHLTPTHLRIFLNLNHACSSFVYYHLFAGFLTDLISS